MNAQARLERRARDLIAGQSAPPVDVETIARDLSTEIRRFKLEADIAGILYRDGHHRVIVVNMRLAALRQRFAIAHMIGHLILHRATSVHVDQDFRVDIRDPFGNPESEESEASIFAALLLMPTTWLKHDWRESVIDFEDGGEVARLARRYRVSAQAMLLRLTWLMPPKKTRSAE